MPRFFHGRETERIWSEEWFDKLLYKVCPNGSTKNYFFENVKGFTMEFKKNKEKGLAYSYQVTKKLEDSGYFVKGQLVNFGDYGVPQKRTRFILVGIKKTWKMLHSRESNRFSVL